MKDYLGNELNIGDFVVYQGAGNTSCEYGLITMKLIKFTPKGASFSRFDVNHTYPGTVFLKKVSITNSLKLLKIDAPREIAVMFEEFEQMPRQSDIIQRHPLIPKWIHGTTQIEIRELV